MSPSTLTLTQAMRAAGSEAFVAGSRDETSAAIATEARLERRRELRHAAAVQAAWFMEHAGGLRAA